MNYRDDRTWSDRFIPAIKRIVGPFVLEISSVEADQEEASDLTIIKAEGISIACRVRRPGYAVRYGSQITFRYARPSGAKTEWEKIIFGGFADWMFYGHSNASEDDLELWWLVNLDALRWHVRNPARSIKRGFGVNPDGTRFAWIDLSTIPSNPNVVFASSQEESPF